MRSEIGRGMRTALPSPQYKTVALIDSYHLANMPVHEATAGLVNRARAREGRRGIDDGRLVRHV